MYINNKTEYCNFVFCILRKKTKVTVTFCYQLLYIYHVTSNCTDLNFTWVANFLTILNSTVYFFFEFYSIRT